MKTPIIEMEGLTKEYEDKIAVDQLDLTIYKGEIFGLLGPNGAGKSTTILMMMGLSEPTSGSVKVCGIDSTRFPIHVKRKVGYLPDEVGFYEDLTGYENVIFIANLNAIPRELAQERAEELLERVGLRDAMHKKVRTYSRGMRQRLGLADVLIKKPEIIILDEPTLGLDPEGVREFLVLIKKLSTEEGITVLLSSHHLHQVQQICDKVGLFVEGRLLAEGTIQDLTNQLFAQDAVMIEVKIDPVNESVLTAIEAMEDVSKIESKQEYLLIHCKRDICERIAKTIVDSGVSLIHLTQKALGLDEIYHRYFEGGYR